MDALKEKEMKDVDKVVVGVVIGYNFKRIGIVTVLYDKVSDTYSYGWSLCCKDDEFDYEKGLRTSTGRMNDPEEKNSVKKIPAVYSPLFKDALNNVFSDLAPSVREYKQSLKKAKVEKAKVEKAKVEKDKVEKDKVEKDKADTVRYYDAVDMASGFKPPIERAISTTSRERVVRTILTQASLEERMYPARKHTVLILVKDEQTRRLYRELFIGPNVNYLFNDFTSTYSTGSTDIVLSILTQRTYFRFLGMDLRGLVLDGLAMDVDNKLIHRVRL